MDKAAQYLGLARKGGMLAVGEEGSGTAIAAGKGRLLMLAADASPNAQKRAAGFLYGHRAPRRRCPGRRRSFPPCWASADAACSASPICPSPRGSPPRLPEELPGWKETAELLAQREDKLKRRKAAPRKHTESGKRRK